MSVSLIADNPVDLLHVLKFDCLIGRGFFLANIMKFC